MSVTKPGRGLASPDSRRRPRAGRSQPQRVPLFGVDPGSAPRSPAGGTHRVPDPQPAAMPEPKPDRDTRRRRWWESIARAERARAGRLRALADDSRRSASPRCAAAI